MVETEIIFLSVLGTSDTSIKTFDLVLHAGHSKSIIFESIKTLDY